MMAKHLVSRRVNAGEVAELACVSRSAVSRTFTAGASVAPETRARVLAAATTLGYRPARKAAETAAANERPVAVVMANLLSPYFAELSDRLDDELAGKGLRARFFICSDIARIDAVFHDALASDVRAIVVFSAAPSAKSMAAAQHAHVPVVILNRNERVEHASLVWIDGPEVGRSVAELMLAEGRRRPMAIATRPFRARELEGFAAVMEAGGSAPCQWIDSGWGYEDGVAAAAEAFARADCPDAVFAASDTLAIGFLEAARTLHGKHVPDDLSIVGFGNTAPSAWLSHRITTVRVPIRSLIQTAVATLMARIDPAGEPAPRIWLGCDLIERDSTRARPPRL
jgi:DNA-binding LacI/PurR family transcriptional regulator